MAQMKKGGTSSSASGGMSKSKKSATKKPATKRSRSAPSEKSLSSSAMTKLEKFKVEAAKEVGVTLKKKGSNGHLTAQQAGSIGGRMVKKMIEEYKK